MDTGILDTMLATIAGYTTGASGTITGYATSLYGILILLDFILAVLLNIGEVDHIKQLVKKVLFYGFWIWIIREWGTLCDALLDSLMITGTAVGGVDASVLKTPSLLIDKGFFIAYPYWEYASEMSWLEITASPLNWLMAVIGYAGVILAFGILALQIFITYVEFYIASALLLIFIPWGSFKHTSFVAEKAIGAVISYGTKLMMLGAVYGLSSGIIDSMTVILNNGEPDPSTVFSSMLGPFALCLLCWQAPGMAAGLMTGAPTLTAGTAAGSVVAGAAGAAAGGAAGVGAVGMATTGMSSAAKIASGIAGTSSPVAGGADAGGAAGAMQGASSFASSAFKSTGAGTGQGASSAFSSDAASISAGGTSAGSSGAAGASNIAIGSAGSSAAASGAVGTMVGSTTSGGMSGAASAKTASSFGMNNAASSMANSGSGVKTSSAFVAGSVNTGSSSASGSSHTSASSAFKKAINETKQAVPPEATPQGGFSVPLPHDD